MGTTTRYILIQLLKILFVIALALCLFMLGTAIGYSVMGDGNAKDVFKQETWHHITDFFK